MSALNKTSTLAALVILALSFCSQSQAVSLHPDVIEKLRAEGRLDGVVRQMQSARERGMWSGPDRPHSLSLSASNEVDTLRIVVILADFSDNQWQNGSADATVGDFDNLLFSEGIMEYGSMKEYYLENSYGKFVLTGEVYGWYRMPNTYAYYVDGQAGSGSYPQNTQGLVEDVLALANDDINYNLYDNSGDGHVEGLLVVHAGEGRETSGSDNDIHSHQWTMRTQLHLDDVYLREYTIMPEENPATSDNISSIGVFCHEFGHLAGGLPDLYDTDYSSEGIGSWSMMAGGSWNRNGESPAHFDAWCKIQFGFVDPITIEENETGYSLPQVESTPQVFKLWTNGNPGVMYFLIENRQRTGSDTYLPGEGLLIYHIDETVPNNDNENHYLVCLEQADGQSNLENNNNGGDSGDPFPGWRDNREFSGRTNPSSRGYTGIETKVAVWDISDSDSVMTANLDVVYSRPYFTENSLTLDDPDGNGDGVLNLGETADVVFSATNHWADALDVVARLSVNDARLILTVDSVYLDAVAGEGTTFGNSGLPLKFSIPSEMDTAQVQVTVTLTQSNGDEQVAFSTTAMVGGSKILIVDDDNNAEGNYEHYLTDALDTLGLTYDVWDKSTLGAPGEAQEVFPMVFWLTGDHRSTTLTTLDIAFLKDYLDHSGGLFLTGQDIAEHLSVTDPDFLSDYLQCSYAGDAGAQSEVEGQEGTAIGDNGDNLTIRDAGNAAGNQVSVDNLLPTENAVVNFKSWRGGDPCGLEIEGEYSRIVFFSFGFEGINNSYAHFPDHTSREVVLGRIIDYLDERQAAPNRPPAAFSIEYPADGDTVLGNRPTLIWQKTSDPDLMDPVLYRLLYSKSGTAPWEFSVEDLVDTQYTLLDLEYDATYYWKVVAYDSHDAETETDIYSFIPTRDLVPPWFTVRLIPNPIFPAELDIYAYPSEALGSEPDFKITSSTVADSQTMSLATDRAVTAYVTDYRVEGAGTYTLSVCGTDIWGNTGCSDGGFAAAPLFADRGTTLESHTGLFHLFVEPQSVSVKTIALLFEESFAADDETEQNLPDGFAPIISLRVTSAVSSLDRPASLEVDLARLNLGAEEAYSLALVHAGESGYVAVPVRYDSANEKLRGDISELGTYLLGKVDGYNTDLTENTQLPSAHLLHQNSPNPFNPSTSIAFELPDAERVSLSVYNILGQKVITLLDEHLDRGSHSVRWDGKDSRGNSVGSGIYFYRLQTDEFIDTKRMVLLK